MTSITFELDEAAVIIDALATPARRGKMREQTAVRSLTEVSACMRAGFPEMQYPWPGYTGRGGIPPIVEAMTNIWSGNVPVLSRHSNNFRLLQLVRCHCGISILKLDRFHCAEVVTGLLR
jgi:hypothetical protein